MLLVRDLVYLIGLLLASPWWIARLVGTGKWRTDWRGRFGGGPRLARDRPTILVHGVSVGETNALSVLVSRLGEAFPNHQVIVSSTTNTGIERAKTLYADDQVTRFPFDLSFAVRRFLDRLRPELIVLGELEIWPNFVELCHRRGIPVVVVNGRLTARSHRGYRRVRGLVRSSFGRLNRVLAQSQDFHDRFVDLGVPSDRCSVVPALKWDTAPRSHDADGAAGLGEALGIDPSRPLVVAGSTGPGEEEMLLASKPPHIQLLLAPRKPERFDAVAALAPGARRRSGPAQTPTGDVFLLDSLGELETAYSLADAVFVGRSLVPMGGSNPLEPVALGKPTVIGPHVENFQTVTDELLAAGGIVVSPTPWTVLESWLSDPEEGRSVGRRGQELVESRRGSTDRTMDVLVAILRNLPGDADSTRD